MRVESLFLSFTEILLNFYLSDSIYNPIFLPLR